MEQHLGPAVAWWATSAAGLRQGWTVNTPVVGPLRLEVEVADAGVVGGIVRVGKPGSGFVGSDLRAWDALGEELAVEARKVLGGFLLQVDTHGARWPVTVDPTWAPWSAELSSGQTGDHFGRAIHGADVDGDGHDDLLIGAPAHDGAGAGYLFLGGSGLLTGAADAVWIGDIPGGEHGQALASGDLDGDGWAEVMIGAPGADLVRVYERSSTGWPADETWTLSGLSSGERFGVSLAVADFDEDGFIDMAVGAPLASDPESEEGAIYLFAGSPAGPVFTGIRLAPDTSMAHGGETLVMGDQDGDGHADLIVSDGARTTVGDDVVARMYHGAPGTWPTWAGDASFRGSSELTASTRLSLLDLDDAPGLEVVSHITDSLYGVSNTYLAVFGAGGVWDDYEVIGIRGSHRPNRVAAADLTGDGVDDLLVTDENWWGAPKSWFTYVDGGDVLGIPTVLLVAGPDPATEPPVALLQDRSTFIGETLATADVDDDGVPDVIASRPNHDSVYILPAGPVRDWWQTWPAGAPWQTMVGEALAAGDVDGDGLADALVRAEGTLALYRGSLSGLSGHADVSWPAPDPDHRWGDFAAIGDVTGDGRADLVVQALPTGVGVGMVVLLRGVAGGWPVTSLSWAGSDPSFGSSLSVGDVDGDGAADVAIAAPAEPCGSTLRGVIYLFAGGGAPSTVPAWVLGPGACESRLGRTIALGDVDGDGLDELIAAVDERVYVFRGQPGWPSGVPWTTLATPEPDEDDQIGVLRTGDVTGDGLDDIVLSIPAGTELPCPWVCSFVGWNMGWIHTFRGVARGLPRATAVRRGDTNSQQLGSSLVLADVTGDGISDVIASGAHAEGSDLADTRWVEMLVGGAFGPMSPGSWSVAGLRTRPARALQTGDLDGDGHADLLAVSNVCPAVPGGLCTAVLYGSASGAYPDPDVDADGDGFPARVDCDDNDPTRQHAGAEVVGDGIDGDCDGTELCFLDQDGDGAPTSDVVRSGDGDCSDPGEALGGLAEDCWPLFGDSWPGGPEVPGDGRDGNCDGYEDCFPDLDEDGLREVDWPLIRVSERHCDRIPGLAAAAAPVDPCYGLTLDTDGDGVCDDRDTCPLLSGEDVDGDGVCAGDVCIGGDPTGDVDGDGWCDGYQVRLTASPQGAGMVRISVVGPPGRAVSLFASRVGSGAGPCHSTFPVCLDLLQPAGVGSITLDGRGRGSRILQPPITVRQRSALWFQVALVGTTSGAVSNVSLVRSPPR